MSRFLCITAITFSLVLAASTAVAADCDVNQDGVVDGADVESVKAAAMTAEGDEDFDPRADLDEDGQVNPSDFAIILGCV